MINQITNQTLVAVAVLAFFAGGFLFYQNHTRENMLDSTVLVQLVAKDGEVVAHGSGVITSYGIITAAHVTAGDGKQGNTLRIVFRDGEVASAELTHSDWQRESGWPVRDLALLNVKSPEKYPEASINCSATHTGQDIFVVGHPAIYQWALTEGTVITTRPRRGGQRYQFLTTDAQIFRGNSGGPVFDRWGSIVGIVSHGILIPMTPVPAGYTEAVTGTALCQFLRDA